MKMVVIGLVTFQATMEYGSPYLTEVILK